ncbi:MAG: IclR family transcriptional regulator [Candidatus Nanopelagicales bacterium]
MSGDDRNHDRAGHAASAPRRVVPAASRALDILELFLQAPLLSAADIVNRLGLPRTTVHELVTTLVDRRYLVRVPGQPVRYRVGVRLFQLGSVYAEELELSREAQDVATDVSAACDETVHVAVLEGADVMYIARIESTQPVRMFSAVGRRMPARCTGVGKVLLSGVSGPVLDALYPKGSPLTAMTPNSIVSHARLRAQLKEIAHRGLAYDDAESNADVQCVAAPIYDRSRAMVAAMSISVPTMRWDDVRRDQLSELVLAGARELSERLGCPPDVFDVAH